MDKLSFSLKGGAPRWDNREMGRLIQEMDDYRSDTFGKTSEEVAKITWDYAEKLVNDPVMKQNNRSAKAIYDHIPYADDLLAGVGTESDYAQKDSGWYDAMERKNGDKTMNPCPRTKYGVR